MPMSSYVLVHKDTEAAGNGVIHVKQTTVTNSNGITFIRRAFDRIGRRTGITQKADVIRKRKLILNRYGDSAVKGDLTKNDRYNTDETFRVLANNLLSAERNYANTPLSKVENFVRSAAGLVKNIAKLTWYTMKVAFNYAIHAGKFIFRTVKKWVDNAVLSIEQKPEEKKTQSNAKPKSTVGPSVESFASWPNIKPKFIHT